MDFFQWRQQLYFVAVQQALVAQQQVRARVPGANLIQVVAAEELKWIDGLTPKDIEFLKVQRIATP